MRKIDFPEYFFGVGFSRIAFCLGLCLISLPGSSQSLTNAEQQLQHAKNELTGTAKHISALEIKLERAYEEKNRAQLAYDNAGILGSFKASNRLAEVTEQVAAIETELKRAKEQRSILRLARDRAETSLQQEKWNQSPQKQQWKAQERALAERANAAGRSVQQQRQVENDLFSERQEAARHRADQQWLQDRRNKTDGSKLLEELTGTNDDYFNKGDKSVGSILSDGYQIEAKASSAAPANRARHITFDQNDLLNAMTDAQREEFREIRKTLKGLQEDGRALKKGSAGRRVVLAAFQVKKEEFEEKFRSFRGFRGKTVTVYGDPPPTKREIMGRVMGEGDSLQDSALGNRLSPYWRREASGAIIGSDSPPESATR